MSTYIGRFVPSGDCIAVTVTVDASQVGTEADAGGALVNGSSTISTARPATSPAMPDQDLRAPDRRAADCRRMFTPRSAFGKRVRRVEESGPDRGMDRVGAFTSFGQRSCSHVPVPGQRDETAPTSRQEC